MISIEDFQTRSNAIFDANRARWRRKLETGLPKGVSLQIASHEILPYTRKEFGAWLWKRIQLGAIQCPHCRAAMDILSLQVDHMIPLSRGGGPGLDNLEPICHRCNTVKADLTRDEYVRLIQFFDGPGSTFRARIEGALINGSMAKMTRFFPRAPKKGTKLPQPRLSLELGEF